MLTARHFPLRRAFSQKHTRSENKHKTLIMNPIPLILLVVGGALAWSVFKTAKAAINLNYNITRFGIYKFATDGAMVLRVRVQFGNLMNQPIRINMVDLAAYFNPSYQTNNDGSVKILSRGNLLATLADASGFVIPANSIDTHDFYINVRWTDIAKTLITNISNIVSIISNANGITDVMRQIVGMPVLLTGAIKAENVVFNVQQIVSLTDDRQ